MAWIPSSSSTATQRSLCSELSGICGCALRVPTLGWLSPPAGKIAVMTDSESTPLTIAGAYFGAWKANDIEQVRPLLADNVDFEGPLGATQGLQDTLQGLGRMFATTEHVEVVQRWVDGPDVLTWFQLRTSKAGPLAIVNWSHVEDGRITRIRVTFDPRPMLT